MLHHHELRRRVDDVPPDTRPGHHQTLHLLQHAGGRQHSKVTDLPTFYEIKAEDLPTFCTQKLGARPRKYIAIFYLPVMHNEPIISISTSLNRTEILKLVLNNNHSRCIMYCSLFAMTSKVRKKRKNFKINRKGGRFSKNSLKAEDLPLYLGIRVSSRVSGQVWTVTG